MDDRRGKRGTRARNPDRSEDEKTVRPSAAPATGGGGIFKSAAVAVLRQHRKLMTTGDITRLAVDMGLLKCQGKTPEATMASALYTDVKRKLQKSLFTRPQEGLFGLREWLEEGYYPEGWVGPPDGLGLAPFKRRNNASAQQSGGSAPAATSKAGRTGVRTGPGRSSKSRAARSWRSAASDAEDEDIELDDDDDDGPTPTGRSHRHGAALAAAAASAAAAAGAGASTAAGEEDGEDGEGEEVEAEEEAEEGDDMAVDTQAEGQDEHLARHGAEEAGHSGMALDGAHHGGGKEMGSSRGQRASSPGRRVGKGRSGGGMLEAGLPQDECLSPLHMLGEAAASESQGDMAAERDGTPPAKRKRPTSITVPDRGGLLGGVDGSATPKSPYEDSLVALHEIATSPSTFELTSQRELPLRDRDGGVGMSGRGAAGEAGLGVGAGGGKVGRMRPRLHVDVPSHGPDLGAGPGSRGGGTPGTTLLTDNPMMLSGETTPAILLQASPVTTSNGQQAMMLRQAPVLVTLPPALASPTAASAGQLDTPALLHVQLPAGAPSELMQTTLITPNGGNLTPFRGAYAGAGSQPARGGLLKTDGGPSSNRPPGRRVSFSGQVGILGPPSAPGVPVHQPLQPPAGAPAQIGTAAAPGAQASWPPQLTSAQVEREMVEISRMQAVVERLESKLGNTHPQVGKAWLALSRMYQHIGDAERHNGGDCLTTMAKAAEALRRAWAVCRACAESCGSSVQCDEAFRYLTARTTNPATEPLSQPADGAQAVGLEDADKAAAPDGSTDAAAAKQVEASGQEQPMESGSGPAPARDEEMPDASAAAKDPGGGGDGGADGGTISAGQPVELAAQG